MQILGKKIARDRDAWSRAYFVTIAPGPRSRQAESPNRANPGFPDKSFLTNTTVPRGLVL